MKILIRLFLLLVFSIYPLLNCFAHNDPKDIMNYVAGRVIDERGFPVEKAKIMIKGKETQTDKSGKFRILDLTFPYDVTIADRITSTAVIYKNISIDNPDLILFGTPNARDANVATLSISFPEIPSGCSARMQFISSDIFFCDNIEALAGEKRKNIKVYWPASDNTLKGKLIFIQKDSLKYETSEFKNITLSGNTVPYEISLKVNSRNIKSTSLLTINLPFREYISKGCYVFADFFDYNSNSDFELSEFEGDLLSFKSIVPVKLPISFRLKVSGYVDFKDGSGYSNYKYSNPGESITLEKETPPELQTPSDKYTGTSGNTEFYYSLGSGTGIFVVRYQSINPPLNFYIVTEERSVYLDYLSRSEFAGLRSVEFKWNVKKYLTYFSVNDFVRPNVFQNDLGYKAVLYSSERTFKTGYF